MTKRISSVSDSDPHGSALTLVGCVRFLIGNADPDPEGQNASHNFMVCSAGCSLLKEDGLTYSLYILYGGLGISKLQCLIKVFFLAVIFSNFWTSNPGSGNGSTVIQKAGSGSVSAVNPMQIHNTANKERQLQKNQVKNSMIRCLQSKTNVSIFQLWLPRRES